MVALIIADLTIGGLVYCLVGIEMSQPPNEVLVVGILIPGYIKLVL